MNYTNYEASLGKLLLLPDTRLSKTGKEKTQHFKGIYVISRSKDDLTFKIGVAYGDGGLKPRLQNYKLCYPYKDEFFVHYIIITATATDAKMLERKVLGDPRLSNTERNPVAQGRKSTEWKVLTSTSVLKKVLITAMDNNSNLWTHCVVFSDNGWNIVRNFDGSGVKHLTKPKYTSKKKPSLYDNVDVDLKHFHVERNKKWKNGDVINTPWGKATVVKVFSNGDLSATWVGYKGATRIKLH
jgi:hypothetical protein